MILKAIKVTVKMNHYRTNPSVSADKPKFRLMAEIFMSSMLGLDAPTCFMLLSTVFSKGADRFIFFLIHLISFPEI